jgi:hypothetical protein
MPHAQSSLPIAGVGVRKLEGADWDAACIGTRLKNSSSGLANIRIVADSASKIDVFFSNMVLYLSISCCSMVWIYLILLLRGFCQFNI